MFLHTGVYCRGFFNHKCCGPIFRILLRYHIPQTYLQKFGKFFGLCTDVVPSHGRNRILYREHRYMYVMEASIGAIRSWPLSFLGSSRFEGLHTWRHWHKRGHRDHTWKPGSPKQQVTIPYPKVAQNQLKVAHVYRPLAFQVDPK